MQNWNHRGPGPCPPPSYALARAAPATSRFSAVEAVLRPPSSTRSRRRLLPPSRPPSSPSPVRGKGKEGDDGWDSLVGVCGREELNK